MSIDWNKRQPKPKAGLGTQEEYDALNVLYRLCEDYTNLTGNSLFVQGIEHGTVPVELPVCTQETCNNTASLYRVGITEGPTYVCVACVQKFVRMMASEKRR